MILQSLVQYYEALEKKGKITSPGWCQAKVSFALNITREGELVGVIPLKDEEVRGKKTVFVPQIVKVPQMSARAVNISANFLCDHSGYLLGIDSKGKPKRTADCYQCAKEKHLEILKNADSEAAAAIINFFEKWQPQKAEEHPALKDSLEEILEGGNLIFQVDHNYAHEDTAICREWRAYCETPGEGERKTCLVTGEKAEIARTHGVIRGVQGAQSSGAALVSFNAKSFESYGKEQSYNAPVGEYAVYAYTTALSTLLADKTHMTQLGDITIVYWAKEAEEVYQDVFAAVSEPTLDNQELVDGVFKNLAEGKAVVGDEVIGAISPNQNFYILGLSPNTARLSVRFFYQDSFGTILKHLKAHYDRLAIVKPSGDKREYLGIWHLLQETVNKKSKDKKPIPSMAGNLYRGILSGGRYPESLYQSVLGRIRAEQDDKNSHSKKITRGRAAIIKAHFIQNRGEEITMGLNNDSKNVAYVLGRQFAVLEAIQQDANPGINATIKDRYFNSACATPASIFPVLFKLKNSHIRKLEIGKKVYYEKLLVELQDKLEVSDAQESACPKRLTLDEQGMFVLGYYHQTQKRFEKKQDTQSKESKEEK